MSEENSYLTVVIEYLPGEPEPEIKAYMPCLGGRVIAVQFNNAFDAKDEENNE